MIDTIAIQSAFMGIGLLLGFVIGYLVADNKHLKKNVKVDNNG